MKKISKNLLLALLSALLGGLVGVLSAGFLHLIEWGQELIWKELTPGLPLQTLLVCTLGGVLVGLCQRFLGDHPKNITDSVREIRQNGRLDYHTMPNGLTTVAVSLISGASLGPESAIVELLGGFGTMISDIVRWLRGRFSLATAEKSEKKIKNWLSHWPNYLALVVGLVAFIKVLNGMYSGGFLTMSQTFHWSDLLWSIPMGVLGAGAGMLFLGLQEWMKKAAAPVKSRPVLLGSLSGIILGITASLLPLMLFSGQHQLQQVYLQAAELGFWTLLLIGLARLVLVNLLLASGWKGGQFLPIMFSAAALGLAVLQLLPAASVPAAILGVMAGLIAVVLPKPIIAFILMALMLPIQYVGISAAAVGVVMIGKQIVKKISEKKGSVSEVPGQSDS